MPDLGLPHNVRRIHGGFFTGALYRWESDAPIVPVDATVNLCGVSIFKTSVDFKDNDAFQDRIARAHRAWEECTPFSWNFDNGNHFIIYAETTGSPDLPAGRYLVLHSSPSEFKKQYNGLYPTNGNWYANDIKVHQSNGRYLRYLTGRPAARFIDTAAMLETYQRERQRLCAGLVAGESELEEEFLSVPHYGMPDESSIAIGCQWLRSDRPLYLLLTRPHEPLFLIRALPGGPNVVPTRHGPRLITPHGLGVESTEKPSIRYLPDKLEVSDRTFSLDESLAAEQVVSIRDFSRDRTLGRVLEACPGEVVGELRQIYSYYRNGVSR